MKRIACVLSVMLWSVAVLASNPQSSSRKAVSTFPYSEDFESGETLPEGWVAESPSEGDQSWGIQVFNDAFSALDGEKRAGIGPRGTEDDNRAMLVSPVLDLSLLKQPVLSFYRFLTVDDNMSMLGYSDTLNVYYRESSEAEWQLLSALTGEANLAVPGMMQWASADIVLPSSSAQAQLAFEAVSKIAGKSIYLDNIEIYDNAVTIAEFPWEEHFENNGSFPRGWTTEQVSGEVAWGIQMSGATPSDPDGLYGAAIFPSVPLAGNVARLVTPALDFGSVEEPVLHFSHKIESNSLWGSEPTLRDTLKLYYKTSQGADWRFLGKYTGTGTTATWVEESVNLPESSNDYYVAFEAVSAIGSKAMYLDDIRVDAVSVEEPEEPEPEVPSIVSPYIEETFDGLVPENWVLQGFVHFTSGATAGYGNSIPLRAMLHQNAKQAYVQTCPVDMRSAPIISFWYKAMNQITVQGEGGYPVSAEEPTEADKIRYQVLVSNDSGYTWETIQEIAFGQHQASGDFAQVRIDAAAYANDTCMIRFVFEPNLEIVTGAAQVNLYFDQVTVGTEMGKDLGIASLQGTQLSMPGDSLSFTVEVSNAGSEIQQEYSVRFVQKEAGGSETEIASETGIPIAKGQTVTYHFNAMAAEEPGDLFYYAEVVLDGDVFMENNRSDLMRVQVLPLSVEEIQVGEGEEKYKHPVNLSLPQSLSQTIYYPDELGTNGGLIRSLSYYAAVSDTNLKDIPVQVWIGETWVENLKEGWIHPDSLTLVYDGAINFPEGECIVDIPFDAPYAYQGKNLVVYAYRGYGLNGGYDNDFMGESIPDSYRTIGYASYAGDIDDPLNPQAFNEAVHGIPNTLFRIDFDKMGSLSGLVQEEDGTPVADAKVQIEGTTYGVMTDKDGKYSFAHLTAGDYTLHISKYGYVSLQQAVSVEENEAAEKNIVLGTVSTYTVSGKISGTNAEAGLAGVRLSLKGYADYSATTDAEGYYSFENVYESESKYLLRAMAEGYLSYYDSLKVEGGDKVLDIVMDERPYPVTSLAVQSDGDGMRIDWTPPVVPAEYIYVRDDSTYENGVHSATSMQTVWYGSLFETGNMGEVISVDLLSLAPMDGSSVGNSPVVVDIFDAERKLVGSSDPFILPGNQWVNVLLDNVPYSEAFYVMVRWDAGSGSTNFLGLDMDGPWAEAGTGFYCSQTEGWLSLEEQLEIGGMFMIRPHVQGDAPKTVQEPAPTGYKVYRFADGDSKEDYVLLKECESSVLTYTDMEWEGLESGVYHYAVSAVYCNRYESQARKTDLIGKDMEVQVVFHLSTNAGLSAKGSMISLTGLNEQYNHDYSMLAESLDPVMDAVWKGRYALQVELEGFHTYIDTVEIIQDTAISLELIEHVKTPEGLRVEPVGNGDDYLFSWNNPVQRSRELHYYSDEVNYNAMQSVYQSKGMAYGVIYDLTAYPDAKIEKMDFYHAQWGHSGTWTYKIHVMDMEAMEIVHSTGVLQTTGDGTWETGIDLGNIELGGMRVGIFMEPLSGEANDAYPVLTADMITTNQHSYMLDMNTLNTSLVYTNGGSPFSEYLMNLYVLAYDSQLKIGNSALGVKAAQKYDVYLDGEKVAETVEEEYVFSGLEPGSKHVAGVKAFYVTGESELATVEFTVGNVAVEDGSLDALSLYPNPFVDEIRIDGPWETVSRISIMNLRGQLLAEFSGRSVLKVSTLPGGLYFIRVEGKDGGFRTYKMVKH